MAQVIAVSMVDDLDRAADPSSTTPATETVRFSHDGVYYEIDLSAEHAKTFSELVAPYKDAGRRQRSATRRPRAVRRRSEDIRAWARTRGLKVSERGRIPASVVAEYEAEHA